MLKPSGVGFGNPEKGLQYGLRYHATLMKSIAEIATPFDPEDPTMLDFYMGSTFGADVMLGYRSSHYTFHILLLASQMSVHSFISMMMVWS